MYMINTLSDIRRLQVSGAISKPLASHLERRLLSLHKALEPELSIDAFTIAMSGSIGILESSDHGNMTALGLPESLAEIMPEWISCLKVANEVYYVLYVMADNDCVVRLYLPDSIMEGTVRTWLLAQPVEEEGNEMDDLAAEEPF